MPQNITHCFVKLIVLILGRIILGALVSFINRGVQLACQDEKTRPFSS